MIDQMHRLHRFDKLTSPMKVMTNAGGADLVLNEFSAQISHSQTSFLAAPYFTRGEEIITAAQDGSKIFLLVGLNFATSPTALREMHRTPGVTVRYFTSRFHAKIYLFDNYALVGSSNITDGGLISNREATVGISDVEDFEAIVELRALFDELWDSAHTLTDTVLSKFTNIHVALKSGRVNADAEIEKAIGAAKPKGIGAADSSRTLRYKFLVGLQQRVYEQYRPAFTEVGSILETNNLRRAELKDLGLENETNRFLNFVRLTYVVGDQAWSEAPLRSSADRKNFVQSFGLEWLKAADSKIPEEYVDWVHKVQLVFGSSEAIQAASKETLMRGLLCTHAFLEQLRFVKGGAAELPNEFLRLNNNDIDRIKRSLIHLLHGPGEPVERIHDVLYNNHYKLKRFGLYCSLELLGTVHPSLCPPVNGRMAKGLRYLGFDVIA